jgi:DNA segregation ATPase FtsK/SpoIIIE, S-DNA-T family
VDKKRRIPVILAGILFLFAAIFTATLAVPASSLDSLPLLPVLSSFVQLTMAHLGISLLGPKGAVIAIIAMLMVWSLFLLATRRTRHFWWMLPLSGIMYYTIFLFSQLKKGLEYPSVFLNRLSEEPLVGQLLLGLVFLIELTSFVLFTYLSLNLHKRHQRKKDLSASKQQQKKAVEKVVVENKATARKKQRPPSRKELRTLKNKERAEAAMKAKAEKSEARRSRKAIKQVVKPSLAELRETYEETLVRIPQSDQDGESEEPVLTHPVDILQPDSPMIFPPIKDLPKLKTIGQTKTGRKSGKPVDVVSPDGVESDTGKNVFVGNIRVLKDASVVLTETPVEEGSVPFEPEPVLAKKIYNPMASLRQRMAKDAVAAQMVVPVTLPSQAKIPSDPLPDEQLPAMPVIAESVQVVAPLPETIQPSIQSFGEYEAVLPAEATDGGFTGEDMELLSGIGGLTSSNAGKSALLTRSKTQYVYPKAELLVSYPDHSTDIDDDTRKAGNALILTLKQFRIEATLVNIVKGPTVTMYEVSPAPGVRVSAIVSLTDNIALQLAARQVRIVAPIPGKQAVGIEVPNKVRSIIGFREMLPAIDEKNYNIPMVLGRKITGEPVVIELTQTPHLLIAGATGSGKSVCVNSLISSILFRRSPKDVRLILVDPKIVELRVYNGIPHLLTPVITDAKKTIKALEFCLYEMDRRYKLLNALAVRNISAYNNRIRDQKLAREKLPFIVVVIDEFADLMTTVGKELETLLARLAAMARAVGIHLVLATQRPSANVITGIIKSNIPTRIAFMVASQIDSRIIIDETGAEKLLGKGDLLLAPAWDPHCIRIQGAFLSDEEVERVVEYAKSQGSPDYLDEMFFEDEDASDENGEGEDGYEDGGDDVLMEKALKIVVERQSASASYLQRRLKIGYNRAARLVEQMEEDGYVGPARGSKPRELLKFPD